MIPRVRAPSRAEFERDFLKRREPVVLTHTLESWPALGRWSLDYLTEKAGSAELISLRLTRNVVSVSEASDARFERTRLSEHTRAMRERAATHYVSAPLDELPEELQSELGVPECCRGADVLRPKFWLGASGTVTPLHFDFPHNLSAQLFGHRRWRLYPPLEGRYLYPNRPWSRAPNFARADPEAPDATRFPAFARARAVETVLAPGEVLFIPTLWWHHVRSLSDSCAIGFWFGGAGVKALGWLSSAVKRVRALNRGEWA